MTEAPKPAYSATPNATASRPLRSRPMDDTRDDPKTPTPPVPPGGSAALPAGSLPKPFLGPQGDENRDPPPNAPAPVNATETVRDIDPKT
jgi:hypothetical protein